VSRKLDKNAFTRISPIFFLSERMMPRFTLVISGIILFSLICFPLINTSGASSVMWSQTYGGINSDVAWVVVEASDGGYAIAGDTYSFGAVNHDMFLVKTDGKGNMEWNKTYGGFNMELAYALVEASDGGYAIAGSTTFRFPDFWLVKTDAYGNKEWSQRFKEGGIESAYSLVATSDGGFAIAGYIWPGASGTVDFWLVKVDASGNMKWNQTYDFANNEYAHSLVATSDGGFAIAGESVSNPGFGYDILLVKTDKSGDIEWKKTYGGGEQAGWSLDRALTLVVTFDGGYAIAGGGLLVKTDEDGNMQWNQTYIGGKIFAVVQASDGGYALAGEASSGESHSDGWLFKTDVNGEIEWNQTYGGTQSDSFSSLVETSDGRFVITGKTKSLGAGDYDFWLIKTDSTPPPTPTPPPEPDSFPTTIMAVSITTTAVIGTGILVYLKKYKRQH
jgi:hypothetical protein